MVSTKAISTPTRIGTDPRAARPVSLDGFGRLPGENVTKVAAAHYSLSANWATNRVDSWSYAGAGDGGARSDDGLWNGAEAFR